MSKASFPLPSLPSLGLLLALAMAACTAPPADAPPQVLVRSLQEVTWEHLNPARGADSPGAATLWGDRQGRGPTGFLLRPADGFESPPHIHNVSYRGVVIRGLLHNDDPTAATMWMPAGSYWTQPAGEGHITAAQGEGSLAYIEIEDGPYLVRPLDQAFDNGERPVNIVPSNLVWQGEGGYAFAALWADAQNAELRGSLLRIPAGHEVEIHSEGPSLRVVAMQGESTHQAVGSTAPTLLTPGSHFSSHGEVVHRLTSSAASESVYYLRAEGPMRLQALQP